jgi:putative lipoic acid-binding regulatory protein
VAVMIDNAERQKLSRRGDDQRHRARERYRGAWLAVARGACDHMSVTRASAFVALLLGVALAVVAAAARGDDDTREAAAVVMRQIEALRAHDFAGAYALASRELRRNFSPNEFEWMVKRAHPEVANSTQAFVVRTHEKGGFVYVTVKILGRNGKHIEALYEIVREGEALKVNALSSRGDEGVL